MDSTKSETRDKKDLYPTTSKFASLLETAAKQSLNFVEDGEFTVAYKNAYKSFKNKDENVRRPLAGSKSEAQKLRNNLHEFVLSHMKEEINVVVEEEDLDKKFRDLEEMKSDFQFLSEQKKAWRPPGDAEVHMKPFYTAMKLKERDDLLLQVKIEREKFNILKARVENNKRERVLSLNDSIRRKNEALEKEMLKLSMKGMN